MSVEDEGAGFHWLDKVDRSFELEGLTERGRGIAMAEILSDSLFFNDMGNKITLVFKTCNGG